MRHFVLILVGLLAFAGATNTVAMDVLKEWYKINPIDIKNENSECQRLLLNLTTDAITDLNKGIERKQFDLEWSELVWSGCWEIALKKTTPYYQLPMFTTCWTEKYKSN